MLGKLIWRKQRVSFLIDSAKNIPELAASSRARSMLTDGTRENRHSLGIENMGEINGFNKNDSCTGLEFTWFKISRQPKCCQLQKIFRIVQ